MKQDITALQETLGYTFADVSLLEQALTHSSYANERRDGTESNERLEFLGDSILSVVAATYLFANENGDEGNLSKLRAAIVCEKALSGYAREIGIGAYLRLGKGEASSGGADRDSTLEDTFEALVAAIYLDGGMEAARAFALPYLQQELRRWKEHIAEPRFKDYKTLLQEIVQQTPEERVEYVLTGESGPDHDKKFTAEVRLHSNVIGHGKGHSKKEAEQQAAREALALLGYAEGR